MARHNGGDCGAVKKYQDQRGVKDAPCGSPQPKVAVTEQHREEQKYIRGRNIDLTGFDLSEDELHRQKKHVERQDQLKEIEFFGRRCRERPI
jgi:hypothetical protein